MTSPERRLPRKTMSMAPRSPQSGRLSSARCAPVPVKIRSSRFKIAAAWLLALAVLCLPAGRLLGSELQQLEEQALKAAVDRVAPAVVRIETFGGLERVGQLLVGTGPTTGLVVSQDGHILSSAFNFVQKPSSILVTTPSGKRVTAEIVARDESRMLVLLKANTDEELMVPEAVPREEMTVGQWAVAVGRTFDLDQPNLSVGVLSATSRIWGKAIQTDAKISPTNYGGPLVDIRGRVLGLLVPLSPQRQGEIAGAEWYDSGIGFAIPLADIQPHLDQMKSGQDMKPGLLGVSLKRGDIYSTPAEVAACPAKSPAYEAGLRVGDKIVEVNGKQIERQAQLRHALGPHYAGDTLEVVAQRGEERLTVNVTLTDKIEPYERPFLGILPGRDTAEAAGVAVRYVYPDSPAAQAGIQPGDRIVSAGETDVADARALQDHVARQEPGDPLKLKLLRDEQSQEVEVTLATLPDTIPDELPPARTASEAPAERPAVGTVEVKLPEEQNDAYAFIPQNYDPRTAYGIVAWLQPPKDYDHEKLFGRWRELCERHDLILVAPQAGDRERWLPTEVDFIRKVIDDVAGNYSVDPRRVVVGGYQAGGAMALLTAFGNRDLVRGVAAVDMALPRGTQVPDNDPIEPLDFYMAFAEKSRQATRIKADLEQLRERKLPVAVVEQEGEPRTLSDEELAALARWIDALDRI